MADTGSIIMSPRSVNEGGSVEWDEKADWNEYSSRNNAEIRAGKVVLNSADLSDVSQAIVHFPFNESSGASSADDIRSGYSANYKGVDVGATTDPAGEPTPVFDGSTSEAPVGSFLSENDVNQSLSTWVRIDDTSKRNLVYSFGQDFEDRGLKFGVDSGAAWARLFDAAGGGPYYVSGGNVPVGEFINIVLVQSDTELRLYLNGDQVDVNTNWRSEGWFRPSSDVFGRWAKGGSYLDGALSDFRVFDEALSDSQVNSVYESGPGEGY